MACLGEITCDSDIGASPFIVAEKGKITSAKEEIASVSAKVNEAITQVQEEVTAGGLDEYSLYINGASPAFDEASKIIENLTQIKEDLDKLAESYEQNCLEHYSKELDKYIEKVKEKIEELKAELKKKQESLAAKEEALKYARNDPDRPSYVADINALKGEISELEQEIKKYEEKLEEAEQVKATTDAEIEKIVAAELAEEEAKNGNPPTTDDGSSDDSSSQHSSYGPSYTGPGSSSRSGNNQEEKKKDEETEEGKIKIDYDLNKDKVQLIDSKTYIKSDKEEQSEIDKYIEELIKEGKVPKDFTGYFYDKSNGRILYLTKGKLEKVNKPALIDGKFFYFKDGIAHIIDHNYTADNMNIPYFNLEKGLLVDGKTYTQEELVKLFKEAPSLATSATSISFLLGRNVNPTELTTIEGWDYKANQDLNGLKLAEQYKVNAFTTNNEEYVSTAIKEGYPVSIAKKDGYVTVVGVDEKGNYKVLDPSNEESLTKTVTKEELFKDVKEDSKDRYTIYGAKSPEEYDKTKTNVTDIRQKTVEQTINNDDKQHEDQQNTQNQNVNTNNENQQQNNTDNANNQQEGTTQNNNNNQQNTQNQNTNTNNENNQKDLNSNQQNNPRNFWERYFNNQNQQTNTNNTTETQSNTNQNSNTQNT